MSVAEIQAIDVHAHFGAYADSKFALVNEMLSADADEVMRRARQANVKLTIASHLLAFMPRGHADPIAGNREAAEVAARTDGLMHWVVVDPLKPETYTQAEQMLRSPKCAGIKIHPIEHGYRIAEQGRALFEFAARHRAVVQSHSGEEGAMPEEFVPFANDFPEVRLIVSHLGCSPDGDPSHQVRAIQASRHGNVFTDTSSSMSVLSGLVEWAVKEVGAERILFGTDSPLYSASMQRARIDSADLSERDKRLILCENATRLFGWRDV
jgi:hypothetical protein